MLPPRVASSWFATSPYSRSMDSQPWTECSSTREIPSTFGPRVDGCHWAIRLLISGSAPLLPETHAAVLERTGVRTALAYLRIAVDPGRISADDEPPWVGNTAAPTLTVISTGSRSTGGWCQSWAT